MFKFLVLMLLVCFLQSCSITQKIPSDKFTPDLETASENHYFKKIKEFNPSEKNQYQIKFLHHESKGNEVELNFQVFCGDTLIKNAPESILNSFSQIGLEPEKSQFLFENNQQGQISVMFLIDFSSSVGLQRESKIKDALGKLIDEKHETDAFGLGKFDGREVVFFAENQVHRDSLFLKLNTENIQNLLPNALLSQAVYKSLKSLETDTLRNQKHLVVFSDSQDYDPQWQDSVFQEITKKNIQIHSIGFGNKVDSIFLKKISSQTNGMYHHLYQTKDLGYVFKHLYWQMQQKYIVKYSTTFLGEHSTEISWNLASKNIQKYVIQHLPSNEGHILDLQFLTNKSTITDAQTPVLEKLKNFLIKNPTLKIEIQTHTDNLGSEEKNQMLSQKRAEAIKKWLVNQRIDDKKIIANGFGETQPMTTNETLEGRLKNRRVAVRIVW
jgi:outer membrane protein OmpA-like peptidoglycan-associated protein